MEEFMKQLEMHKDALELMRDQSLKRDDPESPCFVSLDVKNAEKLTMMHGIYANPTEVVYRMLMLLQHAPSIMEKEQVISPQPIHHFELKCYPPRDSRNMMSGRFNRARVDRVLPSLGDRADWSWKHAPVFQMKRHRRKNTYGRRFPKRDANVWLCADQVERRLRTGWYFKKPLVLTLEGSKIQPLVQ